MNGVLKDLVQVNRSHDAVQCLSAARYAYNARPVMAVLTSVKDTSNSENNGGTKTTRNAWAPFLCFRSSSRRN